MAEEPTFAGATALVDAIVAAASQKPPREVVLLFGSALSLPDAPRFPGVPGAAEVVALVRQEFLAVAPHSGVEFDRKMSDAEQPYQAAFQLLIEHGGEDRANRVVREAVLAARGVPRDPAAEQDLRDRALALTGYSSACEELCRDISGWHLRPSIRALAKLLRIAWERCGRTVLTTNFDPLISVALDSCQADYHRSLLPTDGSLDVAHGALRPSTHVVHLHGSWYESDTLHTEYQIGSKRPALTASLEKLFQGKLLVVLGYGGWKDVVTSALERLAEGGGEHCNVRWAFFESDAQQIKKKYPHVLGCLGPGLKRGRAVLHSGVDLHPLIQQLMERLGGERLATTSAGSALPTWLKPNTFLTPPEWSPAALLDPRYQAVPFFEPLHCQLFGELDRWCSESPNASGRLFVGPAGAGKTRLFVEWCERLRRREWFAGFLAGVDSADTWRALANLPGPALVVIDYAEAQAGLASGLTELARAKRSTTSPLRVVLLARVEGDWWRALLESDPSVAHLFAIYEPRVLSETEVSIEVREALFSRASGAFANLLDREATELLVPDLSDPVFGRPLYVEIAAWAALESASAEATELVDAALDHETAYWYRSLEPQSSPGPEADSFRAAASRFVAAATLLGGTPTPSAAGELIERVQGPSRHAFLAVLERLYTGSGEPGAPNAYLRPLEPDLLGEGLVLRVLRHSATPEDYLERVAHGAEAKSIEHVFWVLGRIISRDPASLETTRAMAQLLDIDLADRALPAARAALMLAKTTAGAPLGDLLANRLEEVPPSTAPNLAAEIERILPEGCVSLRNLALWCTETQLRALPPEPDDTPILERRARLLMDLGQTLGDVGRLHDALHATKQSIRLHVRLSKVRSDATRTFVPSDLPTSYLNLGKILSDLGETEKALSATRHAIEGLRFLAEADPDTFLPNLGTSLSNLGQHLDEVGQHEEALAVSDEALQLRRRLASSHPHEFVPHVALSLINVGVFLTHVGRLEEGIDAMQEAAQLCRDLATSRPDSFLPTLALCRGNTGAALAQLGRREAAARAFREAERHYARLARPYPETYAVALERVRRSLRRLATDPWPVGPGVIVGSDPAPRPPSPGAAEKTKAVLAGAAKLLSRGSPTEALELLDSAPVPLPEVVNAQAVCMLRTGDAIGAQRLLGPLALTGSTLRLRDDVRPEILINYITAALLAEGDIEMAENLIQLVEDCPAAQALRDAVSCWRGSLSPLMRVKRFFLGSRVANFQLPFEPGVLIGVPHNENGEET